MMSIFRPAAIVAIAAIASLAASCSKDDTTGNGTLTGTTPVSITIEEVTATSVKATFEPTTDPNVVYFPFVVLKSYFEETFNGDYAQLTASYIDFLCESNPEETREKIINDLILTRGVFEFYQDSGMPVNSDHIIFAVTVNNQGKVIANPVVKEFKTKEVVKYDATFDFAISDISISTAKFDITPSNKEIYYLSGVVVEAQYPTNKVDQDAFAQAYVDQQIANFAAQSAVDKNMAFMYLRAQGNKQTGLPSGSLQPGVKYLVFAVGVDESRIINTSPSVKEFTTLPANSSSNTFQAKVTQAAIGATVAVTPTTNEPYYVHIFTKHSLTGVNDKQIVASLMAQGAAAQAKTGTQTFDRWADLLIPDTDYEAIVFGCDEWATTPVTRIPFKTDKGGDPTLCTFELKHTMKNVSAELSIIPSDNTICHYFEFVQTDEYPGDAILIESTNEYMQQVITTRPKNMLVGEVLIQGNDRGPVDSVRVCKPETSYTLAAVAFDYQTGLIASKKVYKYQFTTPKRPVSKANITITDKKYYDGDALAAYDPKKYGDQKGFAYSLLTIVPNADAKKWYVSVFPTDLTNHLDEVIINNIVNLGFGPIEGNTATGTAYFKDSTIPNTICAVAADAEGILGPVLKEIWMPERSGVSPISDIIGIPQNASVRVPFRLPAVPQAAPATPGAGIKERFRTAQSSDTVFKVVDASTRATDATSSQSARFTAKDIQNFGFGGRR